jgi:adenosyl cobinamide kinase/adenosyl cobinamide phosphate guanylyltransferase
VEAKRVIDEATLVDSVSMNGIDIESLLKSTLSVNTEEILLEAMRDLVKDEIKKYVRQKFEENPHLKAEAKRIIEDLVMAKMKETYAMMRLGKLTAEVGVTMVPDEMREEMERDIAGLLEKEVARVLEKM